MHGRDAIAAHFRRFTERGTSWDFHVTDVIADGDRACVVYRYAEGEGQGAPRRERAGCAIVRFDGRGTVAEWREYEG